jgi:malate dehydrogenase (oxaloacetate-decarboxylating)(NADP+)
VLRAAQIVVDEGVARPTLIGRPAVIAQRIEKFGLRLKEELDYDVVNVETTRATATSGRPTTA